MGRLHLNHSGSGGNTEESGNEKGSADMTKRNPLAVLFLPLITFGIYGLIWYVQTKEEMKDQGAEISSVWMLIIPIANLIWLWQYAKGVEKITNGAKTSGSTFCLLAFLGCIGMAVIQSAFNQLPQGQ